jgi:tRNA dimethylallyltransferase
VSQGRHPLIAVAGPTGAGKSELALRIAEEFKGEVVNCDSLQIYRHFDIGTAKLPEAERRGIPHHLIGIVDPGEVFTAGEYARRGREALREIAARGLVPVVAGGTGFYLLALVEGLFSGPQRDEDLRTRLGAREARRPGSLHRLLSRFDPEAARRIHAHDVQKLTRAVEICLVTRRPLSGWFAEGRDALKGFRVLKLGLSPPREDLYQRLDLRARRMFDCGLIDEVRRILSLGFSPQAKPFESHGYRQAVEFLRGEITLEEAIGRAQQSTRRYAKRQWTWFRKEPGIVWLTGFGEEPRVQDDALREARVFFQDLQAFR